MPIFDNRALRQEAADKLKAAPNRGKLVLLFVCVSAGLSLAAGLVGMLLEGQIAGTGGLGGLQLRSILSTGQTLLNILLFVFVPFWDLGYYSVALKLGRGEPAAEKDLLNGFRRFGPGLWLIFLRLTVNLLLILTAMQVASIIFSFTPWSIPFYQQIEKHQSVIASGVIDEATAAALAPTMTPLLIIAAVLSVIAMIPVTYRLRMAEYRLMDEPKCGALMALLQSNWMMKGNCVALFKLDLQFWWYYLATVLVTLLCYGEVLLPMVGISLPFSAEVGFVLFYVLALGAQILLYWRCRNQVECTYVRAYDALQEAIALPSESPKNIPWNY